MPDRAFRRRFRRAAAVPAVGLAMAGGLAVGLAVGGTAGPASGGSGTADTDGDAAGGPEPAGEPALAPDRARTVTLSPPADADGAEGALWLVRLRLGPLPPGAAVTVAAADGTVLGGHAPFGADAAAGAATVPVPVPDYRGAGPLDLRLWVELDNGERRPPTEDEFRGAELLQLGGTRR